MTGATMLAPASAADVVDVVRDAVTQSSPLRIVGAGTWLDANRPVRAVATVATAALSGIVEYEPGDLTLTARGGTSLGDIARATAAHGQWLTLDPFGSDTATIGATIATASAGPLAHAFGTPRDLALGVEFVTGKAVIARGGGRVVKNVAGFDLTRLLTGSWGTLGIITEVTVRLRARPERDDTVAVSLRDDADSPGAALAWLRAVPFTPYAFELVDATLANRLGVVGPAVLVRLGGNDTAVRAQRESLQRLGDVVDVDASVWQRLRSAEPLRAVVLRLSNLVSEYSNTWLAARAIASRMPGAWAHGSPGRGMARVVLPADGGAGALRRAVDHPSAGTRVYERLPTELWPELAPSRVSDRLSRGIKRAFDPSGILNPGILGDVEQ